MEETGLLKTISFLESPSIPQPQRRTALIRVYSTLFVPVDSPSVLTRVNEPGFGRQEGERVNVNSPDTTEECPECQQPNLRRTAVSGAGKDSVS